MVGGAGADTFHFAAALGAANIDAILDFTVGLDKIALDDAVFTGLVRSPRRGRKLSPRKFSRRGGGAEFLHRAFT